MTEKFRLFTPEGCKHIFQISNYGTVVNMSTGTTIGITKATGYRYFTYMADDKRHVVYIGRLVALYFLPEPERYGKQIGYKDGDRANCRADNVYWLTEKDYAKKNTDRWEKPMDNGTKFNAKFTDDQVRQIRKSKDSYKQIAERYNEGVHTIRDIKMKKSYKWVK